MRREFGEARRLRHEKPRAWPSFLKTNNNMRKFANSFATFPKRLLIRRAVWRVVNKVGKLRFSSPLFLEFSTLSRASFADAGDFLARLDPCLAALREGNRLNHSFDRSLDARPAP
jgi:hypothetical protein